MRVDLAALVAVPDLGTSPTGRGPGLAVSPTLGLLVTSCLHYNTLTLFALPSAPRGAAGVGGVGSGPGLVRVCTLGGSASPAPMQFCFSSKSGVTVGVISGYLAFTGPATSHALVVTDAGHDAVHAIDVVARAHVGYVAAPGTIMAPRCVAARGTLVAVTTWAPHWRRHRPSAPRGEPGDPAVHLFEGAGSTWTPLRVLYGGCERPGAGGRLCTPQGLRLTRDGSGVVVADPDNGTLHLLSIHDGSFVQDIATAPHQHEDLEECEGGWLVACSDSQTVEFEPGTWQADVGDDSDDAPPRPPGLGEWTSDDSPNEFFDGPSALALVPGLGLVVRDSADGGRVQFFAAPDDIAMASMSPARVGWMVAVARSMAQRCRSGQIGGCCVDSAPSTGPSLKRLA